MKDQAHKLRKLARKSITVGFTSGKGGVGKTNISINLAILLAQKGKNVLILDGDFSLANVDLLLGVSPEYNIKDAILGDKSLEDIMLKGPYGVNIIPAASGVEELADLSDDKRELFIDSFKKFEDQFDFIFIDTPAGIAKNVIHFLLASDEAIVITTPELTALADAYAVIKVLAMNKSLANIKVLVNIARSKNQALETIERIKVVTSQFLGIEVEDFGFIYEDDSVSKAVLQQSPLVISFPYSQAAICLKTIANKLIGLNGETKHRESLFERIVKVPQDITKEKVVNSNPSVEPKPTPETELESIPEPEPEPPIPESEPELTPELESIPESDELSVITIESDPVTISEPEAISEPEPISESESVSLTHKSQNCIISSKNTIRKQNIIDTIALASGLTHKKSKLVMDKLLLTITEALSNNESVKLQKFGTFGVKIRKKRKYYNPVFRKLIEADARTLPYFKVSKCLIEKM